MFDLKQRLGKNPQMQAEILRKLIDQHDFDLRAAAPGIITSFDPITQTCTVQLATKEILRRNKQEDVYMEAVDIPVLPDVPLVFPRAGGFVITFPVVEGDECLVVFADTYIDSWWQNGCSKNSEGVWEGQIPASLRRHDLSDAFAIPGPWSQPKRLATLSTSGLEIKTIDDKNKIQLKDDAVKIFVNLTTYIEVKDGAIKIFSTDVVDVEGQTVNVKGSSVVLAEGTLGVARVGDAVAVTVPEHGTCTGTITAGSSKVKAG